MIRKAATLSLKTPFIRLKCSSRGRILSPINKEYTLIHLCHRANLTQRLVCCDLESSRVGAQFIYGCNGVLLPLLELALKGPGVGGEPEAVREQRAGLLGF